MKRIKLQELHFGDNFYLHDNLFEEPMLFICCHRESKSCTVFDFHPKLHKFLQVEFPFNMYVYIDE